MLGLEVGTIFLSGFSSFLLSLFGGSFALGGRLFGLLARLLFGCGSFLSLLFGCRGSFFRYGDGSLFRRFDGRFLFGGSSFFRGRFLGSFGFCGFLRRRLFRFRSAFRLQPIRLFLGKERRSARPDRGKKRRGFRLFRGNEGHQLGEFARPVCAEIFDGVLRDVFFCFAHSYLVRFMIAVASELSVTAMALTLSR